MGEEATIFASLACDARSLAAIRPKSIGSWLAFAKDSAVTFLVSGPLENRKEEGGEKRIWGGGVAHCKEAKPIDQTIYADCAWRTTCGMWHSSFVYNLIFFFLRLLDKRTLWANALHRRYQGRHHQTLIFL